MDRTALVTDHEPLARSYAKRLRSPFCDYDELLAAGRAALWEAALAYDPDRGPFAPWARLYLRRRLTDEVARAEGALVRHDFELRGRVLAEQRAEAGADTATLAARLGLPAAQVARVLAARPAVQTDFADGAAAATRTLERHATAPASSTDTAELLAELVADPRDLLVALRHTGADGAPAESLTATAERLGESKEAVRARWARALQAISEHLGTAD